MDLNKQQQFLLFVLTIHQIFYNDCQIVGNIKNQLNVLIIILAENIMRNIILINLD
jgi:hypothetical protein